MKTIVRCEKTEKVLFTSNTGNITILVVRDKKTSKIVGAFMGESHSDASEKAYDAGFDGNEYNWECR